MIENGHLVPLEARRSKCRRTHSPKVANRRDRMTPTGRSAATRPTIRATAWSPLRRNRTLRTAAIRRIGPTLPAPVARRNRTPTTRRSPERSQPHTDPPPPPSPTAGAAAHPGTPRHTQAHSGALGRGGAGGRRDDGNEGREQDRMRGRERGRRQGRKRERRRSEGGNRSESRDENRGAAETGARTHTAAEQERDRGANEQERGSGNEGEGKHEDEDEDEERDGVCVCVCGAWAEARAAYAAEDQVRPRRDGAQRRLVCGGAGVMPNGAGCATPAREGHDDIAGGRRQRVRGGPREVRRTRPRNDAEPPAHVRQDAAVDAAGPPTRDDLRTTAPTRRRPRARPRSRRSADGGSSGTPADGRGLRR